MFNKQLIVPPDYPEVLNGPVVFLAGPIQGAADWQTDAITLLNASEKAIAIASPRRSDKSWEFDYDRQVEWETKYLEVASRQGVILFWMASEAVHKCDRAYAQTTRVEYGEWLLGKSVEREQQPKVAIGIEEGYTGAKYVRKRMSMDAKLKNIPIFTTLKDTCDEAVRLLPAWRELKCDPI